MGLREFCWESTDLVELESYILSLLHSIQTVLIKLGEFGGLSLGGSTGPQIHI